MLRYLFTAEFIDGTRIVQDQKDTSKKLEGKNTYYDLLNSDKKLKRFSLTEQKLWNPAQIVVDLLLGTITVNGVTLYSLPLPIEYPAYELYWDMEVKQTMAVQHDKDGKFLKSFPLPENRVFYIGWKTTIDSVEYKQVIGVK